MSVDLALGLSPDDEPLIIAYILIDGKPVASQEITASVMTIVASKVLKQGGKAVGTMVPAAIDKSQTVVAGQRIKFTASKIEGLH